MDHKLLADRLFPHINTTPEDIEARYPKRDLPEGAKVTRMGPSPTGFMHLGNLYGALVDERLAHQSKGVFYLRIEDTDRKREVEGGVQMIIVAFRSFGLPFDEGATPDGETGIYGPYRQSQRAEIYQTFVKSLVERGMAYPCFCTEEELAEAHRQQEENKENFGYYGKYAVWRDRSMEDIQAQLAAGNPWVLRFRSEGSIDRQFKFDDLVKGKLTITENNVDHVLLKSDGIPTYHFAHAVDDHLMRTTHVVRGDEWLPSLPFHIQLFQALGFKLPKYVHIGPLMKMDGSSKRKLSKRKDPELALTYYKAEGFPIPSVREYIMTVLNSNFEDWRRANPDADIESFKFSPKKLNPAGSLFDYAKLVDVSKNVISRMTAEDVYTQLLDWAKEFDTDFAAKLEADPDYAKRILAIGRGGKKPRKDLAVWKDAKPYMGFFYDEYLEGPVWDETFSKTVIRDVLERFLSVYDFADDSAAWFAKVKEITEAIGFTTDMKAYKADPAAFPGTVADVSTFLRQAVTGKTDSPDLYTIMQILGYDRTVARIRGCISQL